MMRRPKSRSKRAMSQPSPVASGHEMRTSLSASSSTPGMALERTALLALTTSKQNGKCLVQACEILCSCAAARIRDAPDCDNFLLLPGHRAGLVKAALPQRAAAKRGQLSHLGHVVAAVSINKDVSMGRSAASRAACARMGAQGTSASPSTSEFPSHVCTFVQLHTNHCMYGAHDMYISLRASTQVSGQPDVFHISEQKRLETTCKCL